MSQETISPIVSAIGLNDGANNGFWRIQPRDKGGQWIEMGADVLAILRGLKGSKVGVTAKYVGPSGTAGKARILVQGDSDLADGVYELDSHILDASVKAKLPESFVKSKGIPLNSTDKFGNKVSIAESDVPTIEDVAKTRTDITDNDIRLSKGELTDEERSAEATGREESPLAELPGGFESLNREEAKKLLRDSGIEPDDFEKGSEADDVEDPIDSAVRDVMADVAFGDEVPNLDQLIDAAVSKPKEKTQLKFPEEMKPGDIIIQNGIEGVVQSKPESLRTDADNRTVYAIRIAIDGKVETFRVARDDGYQVVSGRKGVVSTPETAKPTKPTAPEKPKARAPKPKAPKAKKAPTSEEVNLPNRKDDGKDIAPSAKSVEELRDKKINNLIDEDGKLLKVMNENGKPRTIEDPNSIIDALLEENPNAKIKDDGTVVVERGSFTDTDGTNYNYEVGVQRTVGNQFMERYTLTDAASGEVKYDFYNSDYKDSFAGMYGKTNGLTRTRDLLLGREVPGKKGVDAEGVPVDKELSNYFGPDKNIEQRLKYLRKTKDVNNWRLVTAEENIKKYLIGRSRELNKSELTSGKGYRDQYGNVRRSFVASTFEAIDLKDDELIKERLVQLLGRTPNTPESVDLIVKTLRSEITSRYKGTPREKELQALPLHMKSYLSSVTLDLRSRDEVPFVSEDGVSRVKVGDRVRFINNEGDMVVGEVSKLIPGSGKNGGFKDTAQVRFGDQTVNNLQTRNMLHTDEPVTEYASWVKQDEKIKRRATELGIDFDEWKRRREDNPDYEPGSDFEFPEGDAGAPYLGEAGVDGDSSSNPSGFAAEDLAAGDPLFSENGEYLGTVIDVTEVPSTEGGDPGYAITFLTPEGNESIEVLDKGEIRSPK
jgi:hypothetical protein